MAEGKFGGGNGNWSNPFIIEDVADLSAIRSNPSACYKLKNRLDLKDVDFEPIKDFSGQFDGNCQSIYNLSIDKTNEDNIGLFANVKSNNVNNNDYKVHIYNVSLINCTIKGHDNVGCLVGNISSDNIDIHGIYVGGSSTTVTGHNEVGGIIGMSGSRNKITIEDLISDCSINGNFDVGGIIGQLSSYGEDTTKYSSFNRGFFLNTIKSVDELSANPTVGKADEKVVYTDLYYEKSKVPSQYEDEKATGVDKEFFYTIENFPNFQKVGVSDPYYPHDKLLYVFSQNNYPVFCFNNHRYYLFKIANEYYKFDNTTNDFVKLDTPAKLTYTFFVENGIKDTSKIPSSTLRKVLSKQQNLTVLVLREHNNNNNNNTLQVVKDTTLSGNIKLELTTHKQKATVEDDYNPLSVDMVTYNLQQKEASKIPLIINGEYNEKVKDNDILQQLYINYNTQKDNNKDFSLLAQYNDTKETDAKVKNSGLKDTRDIRIESSKHADVKGLQQVTKSEYSKPNNYTNGNVNTKVTYDYKKLHNSIKTNVTYTLYNTIVNEKRGVHVEAHGENKSRYLISINNGKDWLNYNSKNNSWEKVSALQDIYNRGVTMKDLASRTVMNALPTDYKSKIKIASAISVESFNNSHTIKGLNIEFEPNSGPDVQNFLSNKKNDNVVITGKFFDNENDDVFYQLYTKSQIETDYRQLLPTNKGGWLQSKNEKDFEFKIPLYEFKNGSNMIKIVTKDTRGEISEKTINMTLIEGAPAIKINSNNQFYANITLSHSMNKRVHFKIFINGKQKAPATEGKWSEWHDTTTPFTFDYTWDTEDVLNGLPNEIQVVVQDEMQTETFATFNVLGEYKALLFKDENNFYYSTDTGEVLQQLDFGTVIGGINTDDYTVTLENKTGLSMNDIIIFPDSDTQEDKAKIKLSHTGTDSKEGFVSSSDKFVVHNYNTSGAEIGNGTTYENAIKVPYVLDNNDTYKFHVRIESTQDVPSYRHKIFRVLATGNPIDTSMVTANLPQGEYATKYNNEHTLQEMYLKEGEGLFQIKVKNTDKDALGLNEKSIFVAGNDVYIWKDGDIIEEAFMKCPISDTELQSSISTYQQNTRNYSIFAVTWLDTLFKQYYGDTLMNLVNKGDISFTRRYRTNEYYDGHVAWLKDKATNKDINFTLNYHFVEK